MIRMKCYQKDNNWANTIPKTFSEKKSELKKNGAYCQTSNKRVKLNKDLRNQKFYLRRIF